MIGSKVAQFEITAKIGEGGMGEVYKATDTKLRREVALKFLPEYLAQDVTAQKRFEREARSAAAIDHPYICKIHEIGEVKGKNFIVMEYVEGRTLKEKMAEGRVPLKESLKIASDIASALEKAHKAGIVHRDLKPDNIMLTPEDHVKVMDFGLAKRFQKEEEEITANLTREGTALGTLIYMSPEQLRGQPVDTRSDIFSFGVLIFEMLTGVHPFRTGTRAETINAILSDIPSPLSRYLDNPSDILQHTLDKMLAKDAEKRYQSIREVRTNLNRLTDTMSVTGVVTPAKRRSGPSLRTVAIAFAVLGLAAVAWFVSRSSTLEVSTTSHNPVPLTTYPEAEGQASLSPDGSHVVFIRGETSFQGNLWVKPARSAEGRPLQLTESGQDFSPVWSPDGQNIAFFRPGKEGKASLRLIPSLGGPERILIECRNFFWWGPFVTWAPDSNWLVFSDHPDSDDAGLFAFSRQSREKRRLTRVPSNQQFDFSPSLSPDGLTLAFVRVAQTLSEDIYVLRLDETMNPEGEPKRLTSKADQIMGLTWSSGEEIVFSGGLNPFPRLWRIAASEDSPAELLAFAGSGVARPTFSFRGFRLVYEKFESEVNIYQSTIDPESLQMGPAEILSAITSTRWESGPRYSPDGERVVFMSERSGSRELWVSQNDGSELRQLTSFGGTKVEGQKWSPDGRRIAFYAYVDGNNEIYVLDASGEGLPRNLTNHPAQDAGPSWSLDGNWIIFDSKRDPAGLWKIPAAGGEAVPAHGHELAISPDEKWVYYRRGRETWKEPMGGGDPLPIPELRGGSHQVVQGQIYFLARPRDDRRFVSSYNLTTGEVQQLGMVDDSWSSSFTVSPDGSSVLFSVVEQEAADLMLVENFR